MAGLASHDVIVVGGGLAGLAAANRAAVFGLRAGECAGRSIKDGLLIS